GGPRPRLTDATTAAVSRGVDADALGVEARQAVPLAEEARADEQLHGRVGEQVDDDEVDDRREAEGEGEAPHAADGEEVQDDRGEEGDEAGDDDGPLRAGPGVLDR